MEHGISGIFQVESMLPFPTIGPFFLRCWPTNPEVVVMMMMIEVDHATPCRLHGVETISRDLCSVTIQCSLWTQLHILHGCSEYSMDDGAMLMWSDVQPSSKSKPTEEHPETLTAKYPKPKNRWEESGQGGNPCGKGDERRKRRTANWFNS